MSALRTFFSQVIDVVFFVYRAKLPQEISNIFLHTYYFTHNERKKEIDCVAGTKRDDDDDDGDDDADDGNEDGGNLDGLREETGQEALETTGQW